MKKSIFFTYLLFPIVLFAQKHDYNFVFVYKIGIDFNANPPTQFLNACYDINYPPGPNITQWEQRNCATYSDTAGNLLCYMAWDYWAFTQNGNFYEDHKGRLLDHTHTLILNGADIKMDGGGTQALFLPHPTQDSIFYLLHHGGLATPATSSCSSDNRAIFYYTEIHRHTTGQLEVMQKNIPLYSPALVASTPPYCQQPHSTNGATLGVRHRNGKDWWIYTHTLAGQRYIRFLLDSTGFHGPVYQDIGSNQVFDPNHQILAGFMKQSPTGNHIAASNTTTLDLLQLNTCTGELFAPQSLSDGYNYQFLRELAFSSDGSKLYTIEDTIKYGYANHIHQYDLLNNNQRATIWTNTYPSTWPNIWKAPPPLTRYLLSGFSLAPNGKIYVSIEKGGGIAPGLTPSFMAIYYEYLAAIEQPNVAGKGCTFNELSLFLPLNKTQYVTPVGVLPSFPNYRQQPYNPAYMAAGGDKKLWCLGDTVRIGNHNVYNASKTYRWRALPSAKGSSGAALVGALSDTTAALPRFTYLPSLLRGDTLTFVVAVVDTGCSGAGTDTMRIVLGAAPAKPAYVDISLCADSVLLSTTVAQPKGWNFTTRWQPSAYLSDSTHGSTVFHKPATLWGTTQQYIITIFDSLHACIPVARDTVRIRLPKQPFAQPFGAGADKTLICSGDTAQLGITTIGHYAYDWQPKLYVSQNNTQPRPTFTWLAGWTSPLSLRVTITDTANFCLPVKHDTVKIFYNPLPIPTAKAGADALVHCTGDTVQLGGNSMPQKAVYIWSPANWLSSVNVARPRYTSQGATAKTQSYILWVIDTTRGCNLSAADTVQVSFAPPANTLFADAGKDTLLNCCQSASLRGTIQGNAAYEWLPKAGLLHPDSLKTQIVWQSGWRGGQQIPFVLTVRDTIGGCPIWVADTAQVQLLSASFSLPKLRDRHLPCDADTLHIGWESVPPSVRVRWFGGTNQPDILSPKSKNTVISWKNAAPETRIYRAVATDSTCACVVNVSDSLRVSLQQLPLADAGEDQRVCLRQPAFVGISPQENIQYSWQPAAYLLQSDTSQSRLDWQNLAQYRDGDAFWLVQTATRPPFCKVMDSVKIEIDSCETLWIPTAISPNGDGTNDCWTIGNLPPNTRLQLFDRWGQPLLDTPNYADDFCGEAQARVIDPLASGGTQLFAPLQTTTRSLPEGVYAYVITLPNGVQHTGTLTIIR